MAVQRLDRRIDVENPGLSQQRLDAKPEMTPQPNRAFRVADRLEGAPDGILADDLLSKDVALLRRVRAHIAQRTAGHQRVEPARLEEVDEERQLPKRRHRRLKVPFNPDWTKETVEIDASLSIRRDNQGLFTRQVSRTR
jgi:hypothetical protein